MFQFAFSLTEIKIVYFEYEKLSENTIENKYFWDLRFWLNLTLSIRVIDNLNHW